jgi:hypothetical protein
VVEQSWYNNGVYKNSAQDITARFKTLRNGIKKWNKNVSCLSTVISNCSYVLAMFDGLEEQRVLSNAEKNFRKALKLHITNLLEANRVYWRKRASIRWAKLGDENTKFFMLLQQEITDTIILQCLNLKMDQKLLNKI